MSWMFLPDDRLTEGLVERGVFPTAARRLVRDRRLTQAKTLIGRVMEREPVEHFEQYGFWTTQGAT